MKKLAVSLLVLFVVTLSSAATLTVREVLELRNGLTNLDGSTQVVAQGDAPAKVVVVPYTFTSDSRWKIFTALTSLKATAETFEAARTDLVKRLGLAPDEKDPAKLAPFEEALAKDLKRTVDIKLPTITKADLNLDKNQIPSSVLVLLAPMLKE